MVNFLPTSKRLLDERGSAAKAGVRVVDTGLDGATGAFLSIVCARVEDGADGWLEVWASGPQPDTSSFNYEGGRDDNMVIPTAIASDGTCRIFTSSPTLLIVDVRASVGETAPVPPPVDPPPPLPDPVPPPDPPVDPPIPPDPNNWLTDPLAIYAAVTRGDAIVRVGIGTHVLALGKGLKVTRPGQVITGMEGKAYETTLVAPGNRAQMGVKGGVIDIAPGAHGVELGHMTLTQSLDQKAYRATDTGGTITVVGVWSEANDWYLHDLIVDRCSFGLAMWKGSVAVNSGGGVRRLHRVLVMRFGYIGTGAVGGSEHSGNGIYLQTPDVASTVTVDFEDFVVQVGNKIGIHDYASFGMAAPRIMRGVAIMNTGDPSVTGNVGDGSCMYLAKSETCDIVRGHFVQHRNDGVYANNKIGYGSGISPKRFTMDECWMLNRPDLPNQPALKQAAYPIFTVTNIHNFSRYLPSTPDQRPDFAGVKPLGASWGVRYGSDPAPGWEVVPGSIEFPAQFGMPACSLMRRV